MKKSKGGFEMEITRKELKSRVGFILLVFFAFYLVEPAREIINKSINVNPFIFGIGGIILTLLIFEFN